MGGGATDSGGGMVGVGGFRVSTKEGLRLLTF